MKKIYLKSKKHFIILLVLIFIVIFITINVMFMSKYGAATVSAGVVLITILLGEISLVVCFSALFIYGIYYLVTKAIGCK